MEKPYETYWDLTEKERARLTDEQFKKYCKIELMEAGCLIIPDKPDELVLPPMEPLQMEPWFMVGGDLLVSSMEDAITIMKLKPFKREWVSYLGYNQYKAVAITEAPKQVACLNAEELARRSMELSERKAKETEYNNNLAEWNKLNKEVETALESICDDRSANQEKMWRYESIVNSLYEYQGLAGGDIEIAKNFLKKRYSVEEIDSAVEWCETD